MKKEKRKYLENAILNNTLTKEDILETTKHIYIASFIRFSVFSIMLIVSLVFAKKISKLAVITADTVFSHEVYFSPTGYYFTCLGILVGVELIMGLFLLYKNKTLVSSDVKLYLKSFKAYDLIIFILEILVSINFIIMFLITPVTIEGNSMNNTFNSGDKVMIWHFLYEPNVDDVVVLDANKYSSSHNNEVGIDNRFEAQEFYIKRIAAKEEEKLIIKKNPYDDSYYMYANNRLVERKLSQAEWKKITGYSVEESLSYTIPKGKALLLGDNRLNSYDSRYFGLVDNEDILGRVIFRYYPFNKIGNPDKNIITGN